VDFSAIPNYAAWIAASAAIFGAFYIARNKAVLENYRVTVESQNVRLSAQECEITTLKEENTALTQRMDELEGSLVGQKQGYELAMNIFATAVANAGICAIAWDCSNRVLPETVESKPRSHKASRKASTDES
jgi:hypothetical protein